MKTKIGWQLLGAVEPISSLTIFEERCVNSIFTYKNGKWSEYGFNGKYSGYDKNIIDTINIGKGFWLNGNDDNCSVNLYDDVEPILVMRSLNIGSFPYAGQNIITSKETFKSVINEFKKLPNYSEEFSLVLEKENIDFEKNNIFLNIFEFAWCNYQTVINFNNSIYRINTNFTRYDCDDGICINYKCGDSATAFIMVYRVSKEIKSFEVQSFKLDSNDGGLTTIENK